MDASGLEPALTCGTSIVYLLVEFEPLTMAINSFINDHCKNYHKTVLVPELGYAPSIDGVWNLLVFLALQAYNKTGRATHEPFTLDIFILFSAQRHWSVRSNRFSSSSRPVLFSGGRDWTRTNEAVGGEFTVLCNCRYATLPYWSAFLDLNQGPPPYQSGALDLLS